MLTKRTVMMLGLALGAAAMGVRAEPELALKGYCPVTYHTHNKGVFGDSAFSSVYQGYTYFLADAEAKAKFEADPERYIPQFAGLCTTALGGSYGNRLAADPAVFTIVDGKLYLFSSERALQNFRTKPAEYVATATDRFTKPAIDCYCPVAYIMAKEAKKGNDKEKVTFRGRVYCFADQASKEAFNKEPERFVPAYGGFCAEGMSRGKRFPGDPKVFLIHEGRTHVFFDENAKKAFEANPAEIIKNADSNWRNLGVLTATPP